MVSMTYFKEHFGLVNPDGSPNTKKANDVSSNVVSVLQAGAFFGALGSAPISGKEMSDSIAWVLCTRPLQRAGWRASAIQAVQFWESIWSSRAQNAGQVVPALHRTWLPCCKVETPTKRGTSLHDSTRLFAIGGC